MYRLRHPILFLCAVFANFMYENENVLEELREMKQKHREEKNG